ncbi:MAG: DNA topoisomerase VI, partial [Methanomicrobiales archaeon]|nr:DNA topoisomerase VI [Methanomicrobiales archaeon]
MSREEMDALAKERLVGIARGWYDQMRDGIVPYVRLPTR